jgi:hypothetical protein
MSSFNDHALNEEEYYYLRELGTMLYRTVPNSFLLHTSPTSF